MKINKFSSLRELPGYRKLVRSRQKIAALGVAALMFISGIGVILGQVFANTGYVWVRGSSEGVTIANVYNSTTEAITAVKIDDATLGSGDYNITADSALVIGVSYLNSLVSGSHMITIEGLNDTSGTWSENYSLTVVENTYTWTKGSDEELQVTTSAYPTSVQIDGEALSTSCYRAGPGLGPYYFYLLVDCLENLTVGYHSVTAGMTGGSEGTYGLTINPAVANNTLETVYPPAAITGVANGTAKTAEALGLPSTVMIDYDDGQSSDYIYTTAVVTWDVSSANYDPSSTAAQTFTVSGTVTLPEGIVNTKNVSLVVTVSVSVLAGDNNGTTGGDNTSNGNNVAATEDDGDSSELVIPDTGRNTYAESSTAGEDEEVFPLGVILIALGAAIAMIALDRKKNIKRF